MKAKRVRVLMVCMALAASMAAGGCGKKGGSDSVGGTENPDAAGSAEGTSVKNADGKYEPTLTIHIAKQLDENTGRYGEGEDINKNRMTDLTEEKLGLRMETTLLGGDAGNYDTKLRLALTGSEELPDVFPVYNAQMAADMIESGRVKALDEDIEKYMPERLKEIYDKFPETYNCVKKDGKIYGIACTPVLTEGEVMIIRQDWLDALNLKAPTNMDEFEAVIKAFTEDDPDGNGKKDTYGFTYSGKDSYRTGWVADPVMLFSANSGKFFPETWQENESGELEYGSLNEGNKKTLERMAEWHKNGWIFQEAAATGAWDAMMQFAEGKAGILVARPWAIDSVRDVTTVDPNAVIQAYPTIRQDSGDPTYQSAEVNDGWLMFNSEFNNMEAFFDYYDWIYDAAFGTGDFQYGYLKGCDYDIVDGKPVFDSEKYETPVTDPFMPDKSTVLKNRPYLDKMQAYSDVAEGKEPETSDQIKAADVFENHPDTAGGYVVANEHRDELIPSMFNSAPTSTMSKNWEQLQTLEKQVYTKIIYGEESADAFDSFVEEWKANGGDDVTKEVNEWYKSVK